MSTRTAAGALVSAFALAPSAQAFVPDAAVNWPQRAQPLVLPLDGPLGSPFGYRWGRMHEGIDIEGWAETRVRAAASGIVTRTGWLKGYDGYGLVVKIRHEGGLVTMYAHLAKALVRRGDFVSRGKLIGRAGCTGSCTGTHLHFQMWLKGKLVDPLRFLRGQFRT